MKKIRPILVLVLALLALVALCSCKSGEKEVLTEATYYTVTFNSNGGSAVDSQKIIQGGKVYMPTEPVRDGYIFGGWQCNGNEWIFDTDTVNENVTLIAKWTDAATVFNYQVFEGSEGAAIITGLKSEFDTTVRIPRLINGLTVVGIGDGAFGSMTSTKITKIVVPETVTRIGSNAFKGCTGMDISVDGMLISVGDSAFYACDGLAAVSFGDGLLEIGAEAFSGCTALKEIRFPSTLTKINENAFEDCISLKFVAVYDSARLANSAFIGCDALVTVYLYGSEEGFEAMAEDAHGNETFMEAKVYLYSAQKPLDDGDFWYTDEKGKIKLWK